MQFHDCCSKCRENLASGVWQLDTLWRALVENWSTFSENAVVATGVVDQEQLESSKAPGAGHRKRKRHEVTSDGVTSKRAKA